MDEVNQYDHVDGHFYGSIPKQNWNTDDQSFIETLSVEELKNWVWVSKRDSYSREVAEKGPLSLEKYRRYNQTRTLITLMLSMVYYLKPLM